MVRLAAARLSTSADLESPMVRSHLRRAKAFTLVELLVVIGIIALLISILLPALSRANDAARAIKCGANLRSIGQAVVIYANQNKGKIFPWLNDTLWMNPTNSK